MNRRAPEWEKVFVSQKAVKVLSLENLKICQISTMKEQLENRQKTWRDVSLKGIYRWQVSTIKRCSTLLTIRELQMKTTIRWCCLVTQLCLILCNPINYSPPASSVHGIFLARILGWVAMPSSRVFPTQGLNPGLLCLLHWQADSLPLTLPGKLFNTMIINLHSILFFYFPHLWKTASCCFDDSGKSNFIHNSSSIL